MKIILEFDPLTDFHLNWLRVCQQGGKWQSAEDILRPLINDEFERHQPQKSKAKLENAP